MSTDREFADSGVEWLGRLPSDWKVAVLGRESWVRARLGWKGLKAEEYVDEGGFAMLSTPDIKSKDINFRSAARITEARFYESPEIMLQVGDVLLTKDGSTIGTSNIVRDLPEPATLNGSIALLTPSKNLDSRYLYYVIASRYARAIFDRLRGGAGVPHLFQRDINRIRIPFPPPGEQRLIADFLDQETAQIDALVAKQEEFVGLLRERRNAAVESLIASVEARGPRLKHVIRSTRQGWSPQCYAWPADGVQQWAVLKAGAANGGVFRPAENKELPSSATPRPEIVVRAGDLVVSRANTRNLVGSAAVVDGDYPRLMLSDKLYAFDLDRSKALPKFVAVVLGSRRWRDLLEIEASGTSSSMLNISQDDIVNLPMALPNVVEQASILSFIGKQTTRIDSLIAKSEEHIALAKERRSALITAAVTGQLDVRTAMKGT